MREIWFWHRIVSPHMAGLAVALARLNKKVTYVAEEAMSADRAQQGWAVPATSGANTHFIASAAAAAALVREAPENAVHICQGIRANGLAGYAQRALAARNLRPWIVMETVNDAVWYGALKRAEYARLFHARRSSLQGTLAIGHCTAAWVAARGMPANSVYPFAYFLPNDNESTTGGERPPDAFRFVFAGRLIKLKRIDWLINALSALPERHYELWIVGAGPQERCLRELAETRRVSDRIRWLGQLPSLQVPGVLANADCLVLPSVSDGWGAVASEAMMAGTPVVCSDACGVAGAVQASGKGGVFPVKDGAALVKLLAGQVARGTVTEEDRRQLAGWASCLGAFSGAKYLLEILAHEMDGCGARPVAPWLRERAW
jgi:glycosyltransferase involved in cell wall biosynthesis